MSSKDTTPAQIKAVFDNLAKDTPKDAFTVGIVDDVTHTSLEVGPAMALADPVFKSQCRQPRHLNKHKNSWIKVLSNGSALPMILPMQYVILQAKKRLSLPPKPWRLTEVRCEINI